MNSIPAENRELTLAISINQRNPCRHCTSNGTGYYLALTFGTLLSSQRADAQQVHPLGLPCWLGCPTLRRFPAAPHSGGWSGGPPGPRGAWRTLHDLGGGLQGGPRRPPSRSLRRRRWGGTAR